MGIISGDEAEREEIGAMMAGISQIRGGDEDR